MGCRVVAVFAVCLSLAACGGDDAAEQGQLVGSDVAEMSAEVVAALSCLPMDPDGWRRADDPLPEGRVALASNDDAIVATTKLGPQFRFWSSEDGLTWETAASTPDVVLGQSEHALAGGPHGFVAVATSGQGEPPNTPVVVFSDDGTSWESVDPATLPEAEVAWLTDVFAGPDGFLIVGASADHDLSRFAWFSDDGRTWTGTDLPIPDEAVAATATGSGWAALTLEYPDSPPVQDDEVRTSAQEMRWISDTSHVRLWTSSDGRRWTEAETESPPPGRALQSYMWTAPLMVHGDAWVLALNGATDDDPAPQSPTVWMSTDDGRTWSEHTVWDDPDRAGFAIHDTAVIESGLLVAGYQDEPGAPGAEFVHSSSDGMTWRHCWTDPLELLAIEPVGDALVAVTGTGTVQVWNAVPG